ncbi:MAG: dihydrofolate synthase / folylpolyglutamate synthase [Chloroflexota bacterium]|nr:dihydrofolate synthase / folylpolyglutamate synthase [Chloroflexota bacterium]
MDEQAALAALQARGRFGIRLGLGRTRALLRALGDPQLGLPGALVAGTNGKGSVQALVAEILLAAGHRVGQTPKPHLVSYRERIVVDGRPIASEAFAALVDEVLVAAERVERRHGPPTEFELVTAAAFTWFRRSAVDVGVVEVGLGGRLDATNVWDGGVAAVTNVDRDHMEHLGSTIPLIAREKAAIVKRGDRAVTAATGEALEVIRGRAARVGAPLEVVEPLPVVSMDRAGLVLRDPDLGELRVGLLGRHQSANAAVALGVIRALAAAGIAAVGPEAIRAGLAAARWPGRLELLTLDADEGARPAPLEGPDPAAPDVLLDGAHNVAGAHALAAAVDELAGSLSPGKATLLLGILADKEVEQIVAALAMSAVLAAADVVATTVPDTPRALAASDVADAWGRSAHGGASVTAVERADDALRAAMDRARAHGGPLIVAGSLYLVGHVRGKLCPDPLLQPTHH